MNRFQTEEALVLAFVEALHTGCVESSLTGATAVLREFEYQRGRTDVVSIAADGEIIAFEAKLTRWRDALHQAYRNTCFAHRSYVLLPFPIAERASKFSGEFKRRGVGLCALVDGRVVVLHDATRAEPIEPWLSAAAHAAAQQA